MLLSKGNCNQRKCQRCNTTPPNSQDGHNLCCSKLGPFPSLNIYSVVGGSPCQPTHLSPTVSIFQRVKASYHCFELEHIWSALCGPWNTPTTCAMRYVFICLQFRQFGPGLRARVHICILPRLSGTHRLPTVQLGSGYLGCQTLFGLIKAPHFPTEVILLSIVSLHKAKTFEWEWCSIPRVLYI